MDNCNKNNKIIFTGGGTGGHIYPNLALIDEFKRRGYSPIYIGGDNDSLESKLIKDKDIPFYGVKTIKLIRSLKPFAICNNLKIPFTLSKSIKQAQKIIELERPLAIISKGGFASLPCILAGAKKNIPLFAHESDMTLGIANKIAKYKGATILKANPNASFKAEFVGMPLRKELFSITKESAIKELNIITNKPILLILGGSLGASAINDEVKKRLNTLCSHFFVLHVTGKNKKVDIVHKDYLSYEYADNIALFYAVSDVILSRAGATSVFELSTLEKRVVFVPLPKGVSRGDQIDNAYLAQDYGAQILLQDEHFSNNFLPSILKAYKKLPMRKILDDSNGKIADIVCDRLRRGELCKDKKLSQNGSRSYYS